MIASLTASSSSAGLLDRRRDLRDAVEHVAGAEAVGRRDGEGLAEAEAVELGGHVLVCGPVDLVGDDEHGHVGAAQRRGELGVARPHAGACVDDEHHGVGVGDRLAGLALDRARQRVVGLEVHAPRVDELEAGPVPLGVEGLAVAGHTGLGRDDRLAPSREAVRERALADVGEADDRYLGQARHHASPRSAGEVDDPVHDLADLEAGGVDLDRVGGRPQGPVLALGVARVSASLLLDDPLERLPGLGGAPAGALLVARGQEDLERRVGADDGPDVTALRDIAAAVDQGSLAGDHRLAHLRMSRDARCGLPDLRRADPVAHVLAVEAHGVVVEADLQPAGQPAQGLGVVGVDAPGAGAASATERYMAPESR